MFFDKQSEDDFFFLLDRELKKQHAFDSDLQTARRAQLESHLKSAAEALRHAGLVAEAQMVGHIIEISNSPEKFSAEEVVSALESRGWDYSSSDDHDADTCNVVDCQQCEGDDDLTEKEVKQLRKLLEKEDDDKDDVKDDMDDDSFKGLKAMFDAMDKDEQDRFKKEVLD